MMRTIICIILGKCFWDVIHCEVYTNVWAKNMVIIVKKDISDLSWSLLMLMTSCFNVWHFLLNQMYLPCNCVTVYYDITSSIRYCIMWSLALQIRPTKWINFIFINKAIGINLEHSRVHPPTVTNWNPWQYYHHAWPIPHLFVLG